MGKVRSVLVRSKRIYKMLETFDTFLEVDTFVLLLDSAIAGDNFLALLFGG